MLKFLAQDQTHTHSLLQQTYVVSSLTTQKLLLNQKAAVADPPAPSPAAAKAPEDVRAWRTAFLSLRDEIATPPPSSLPQLLHSLLFAHSSALVSASADLPPHEVTSDLLFLMEVVAENATAAFADLSRLIHDICHRVSLQLNSSSWTRLLQCLGDLLEYFIHRASSVSNSLFECLSTLRCLVSSYRGKSSPSDDVQLVKLLHRVISSSHAELNSSSHFRRGNQRDFSETGKRIPQQSANLWEVQTISFTILSEAISGAGSSFPADIWKSTIEVFRKVMDVIASKSTLMEENSMSRFYAALLHCMHLVLKDPKGSISDHVSSFVAALRIFFTYGITSKAQLAYPSNGHTEKEPNMKNPTSPVEEPKRSGPYRPPHLRQRDTLQKNPTAWGSKSFSDAESSTQDFASSDSDYSDSDGPIKDTDGVRKLKVRVAAIECIQDLCQADPKSFTTHWILLLPTCDVLQPRKFEATLMTCLLFDPYLKARIASASTLAAMLDGPSPVFLQVAEYKEPSKSGSFTALSVSIGHILVQLHKGILYLIQRENHGRLLGSLFKILMLLISSTPYSRMPTELLSTVIISLQERIEVGFPFKSDQTGLLTASISCLAMALTTSPSSSHVKEMLVKETSRGFCEVEKKVGVLCTLFQYSEQVSNSAVCFEALQALRAVSHNYPSIVFSYWERVSTIVYGFLRKEINEVHSRPWKGPVGNTMGVVGERVLTAAIKVLDECLRSISGFKGTEDFLDEKLLETPFTSDYTRTKKVSSAPLYEPKISEYSEDGGNAGQSGIVQWCDALENHMPFILRHCSAKVRAASVTCFAGITSSVFFSLVKEKQEFILSSLIYAANDEVPSVRSAACRAIGVISCFHQVFESAEILDKFINAIEINTRDPSVSVRITAAWALANICDSTGHCLVAFASEGSTDYNAIHQSVALLIDCALRLSNDGDKIKSNAVRALGNLTRFIKCTTPRDKTSLSLKTNGPEELPSTSNWIGSNSCASNPCHRSSLADSRWLERTVQALVSCVTTGNVKVRWNVCHALSNLFLNETLKLQEMDWAPSVFSILLLLLRDSSNFKVRIQAAVTLAVPSSVLDYGNSFSDVVHGLVHLVENLDSDQISAPSSFKYRVALEKQVTSTLLHLLSLASSTDQEPLKDFLIKKAPFLEEWFKALCSEFLASSSEPLVDESKSTEKQKKEMIDKAIWSLTELFKGRKQHAIAKKFEKLEESIH